MKVLPRVTLASKVCEWALRSIGKTYSLRNTCAFTATVQISYLVCFTVFARIKPTTTLVRRIWAVLSRLDRINASFWRITVYEYSYIHAHGCLCTRKQPMASRRR